MSFFKWLKRSKETEEKSAEVEGGEAHKMTMDFIRDQNDAITKMADNLEKFQQDLEEMKNNGDCVQLRVINGGARVKEHK